MIRFCIYLFTSLHVAQVYASQIGLSCTPASVMGCCENSKIMRARIQVCDNTRMRITFKSPKRGWISRDLVRTTFNMILRGSINGMSSRLSVRMPILMKYAFILRSEITVLIGSRFNSYVGHCATYGSGHYESG